MTLFQGDISHKNVWEKKTLMDRKDGGNMKHENEITKMKAD